MSDEKTRIGKERVESDEREVIPFEPYRMIARDPVPKQVKIDRRTGKPKGSADAD